MTDIMEDATVELQVVKRNGKKVDFDGTKIAMTIKKGFDSLIPDVDTEELKFLIKQIEPNAFVFSSAVSETYGDGNFLKEQSIFKNKILKSKSFTKSTMKLKRKEKIKKDKTLHKKKLKMF